MIKYLKNELPFLVGSIFALVGSIFLIISIAFTASDHKFYQNALPIDGVISELYNENAYVSYTIDRKTYHTRLSYYSSSMYEGQEIDLYYDPDSPQKVHSKSSQWLNVFFMGGGIFNLLLGISLVLFSIRKYKDSLLLKDTGQLIYLKISEITRDYRQRRNGVSPYIVIVQYIAPDNTIHLFKSRSIWYDPTEFLLNKTVPVYFNANKLKQHYVDIDAILPDRKVKTY